ncbi:ABC transporter permease [Paenibacillus woosongensis]|uniref:Uncharacterized protein n=1 Tax=Paenibacillus woosongensis TaxID=307580 RepID=A0A7X2Z428_9BACL|nr:hypothetical protein [Paenibacillus woosongensis]MUG46643.1 hypothetical protein [Paenibacillus woosongensis]
MMKWKRQFALEWNHIFRNPWLMGLPALYGVLYAWFLSAVSPLNNFFNEAYSFHALVQTLTLGIVMLLGILAIRRDIRRPAYEWSTGLPLAYGMRITAKFAAAMAYLTLFSLLAAGLFVAFSYGRGIESAVNISHGVYFFVSYEISYVVTLALAMLLAVCLQNRVVYLIGFCAWMFGTFFMQLFIVERYNLYILRTFHLSELFVEGTRGYELWGYGTDIDEMIRSGLFVLAFAALLLTAAVTILNLLRPTKHGARLWFTAGLSVLLACAACAPYGLLWSDRYSSYNAKINDETILDIVSFWDEPTEMFEVANYDLVLEKAENGVLFGTARLEIPASALISQGKEEITLTLNRLFSVSEVKANGDPVSFTRQGDLLSLPRSDAPEQRESVSLEIRYSGKVAEDNGKGLYHALVQRDNVLLPRDFVWYPFPGMRHVYMKEDWSNTLQLGSMYKEMPFPAAEYRLTVKGFDSKLYTSLPELEMQGNNGKLLGADFKMQVFQGFGKDGISLFGGPFVEVSVPSLPSRIITTPSSRALAEHVLQEWSGYYRYFASWVADFEPKIQQVGYFVTKQMMNDRSENGMYLIFASHSGDNGYAGLLMTEMLLGTRKGSFQIENMRKDIRLPLRSLMWYVYYREAEGLSHKDIENGMADFRMLGALFHTDSNEDPDNLGGRMAEEAGKAIDAGKISQVKEILNYFYTQGMEIPLEEPDGPAQASPIPYEAWEREWERVMGHENGA